jgi:hypothetical protein
MRRSTERSQDRPDSDHRHLDDLSKGLVVVGGEGSHDGLAGAVVAPEALRLRGAAFLTPRHDWGSEIRCFLRDPDGHLVEISQSKTT